MWGGSAEQECGTDPWCGSVVQGTWCGNAVRERGAGTLGHWCCLPLGERPDEAVLGWERVIFFHLRQTRLLSRHITEV